MRRVFPRAAGTALLAGTLVLRAVHVLGNRESVGRFFFGGGGVWTLIGLILLAGPWLTAVSAAAALWLPWDRAGGLRTGNLCAAALFTFGEGLTAFARAMNGHSAYVGAEPLCGLLVLGVSLATLLLAGGKRRRESQSYREE